MKKNTICWDSSVMISYIGGDTAPNDSKQIQATKSVAALIENGDYTLVISTILYTEILYSSMDEHAIKCFDRFLLRKNLIKNVPVSVRIAKKAQEIRNRVKLNLDRKLKTVDAIHAATAIDSEVSLLHAFDGDLLNLDGKDEVDGLRITPCEIPGKAGTLALPEN